jgi:DNA-binding FadR family transcriptional regulator
MTSHIIVIPTQRAHSNHAEVARSIGIDIIAGRYAEGARLPGDVELTAIFRVSRPVLRESVKTLVAKGLLSTKARVGTVVRERADWNMFDADVLAWHLAAERRSDEDLVAMRKAMEWMTEEPSTSTAFAEADLSLHVAVANASGNPFMRSIGGVIEAALRASFQLSAPVEAADREMVLSRHQRIVDAIAAGDAEAASLAMLEVIHNGRRRHAQAVARADRQQTNRR